VYLASRKTQKMTDNMASAVELKVEKLDLSFGCCLMVTLNADAAIEQR
jgi:hypothetical protein